jgi:ribonuclease P protein component
VPARPTPIPDPDRQEGMPLRPERLSLRERRLGTPQMYKKVFESGRALRSAPLTLRIAHVAPDRTRVGFIIRKKIGNAPLRNAIRRMLRACFVEVLPTLPEGTWLIFDVPDRAAGFRRSELRAQAMTLLAAAGKAP